MHLESSLKVNKYQLSYENTLGCPKICDSGPIFMLIKPICLYGILILQNDFRKIVRFLRKLGHPKIQFDLNLGS